MVHNILIKRPSVKIVAFPFLSTSLTCCNCFIVIHCTENNIIYCSFSSFQERCQNHSWKSSFKNVFIKIIFKHSVPVKARSFFSISLQEIHEINLYFFIYVRFQVFINFWLVNCIFIFCQQPTREGRLLFSHSYLRNAG